MAWRKVRGHFSPGYLIFFHLTVGGGQQNMFFFFSKGNWNFLIDYLLPKIHLPSPVIILNWEEMCELTLK
jgi:hypothetical protein